MKKVIQIKRWITLGGHETVHVEDTAGGNYWLWANHKGTPDMSDWKPNPGDLVTIKLDGNIFYNNWLIVKEKKK